jgi:hypothetical protein
VPAVVIEFSDVRRRLPKIHEDKANDLIVSTLAFAKFIAPCIASSDFAYGDAARAILLNAIERQASNAPGVVRESKTIGGAMISKEIDRNARGIFTPQEVQQLQSMCPASPDTPFGGPQYAFPESMFTDDTTTYQTSDEISDG